MTTDNPTAEAVASLRAAWEAVNDQLPYCLYSGGNKVFQLNDFGDALEEILNFIESTPNNMYFYDQFRIARMVHAQDSGVLLLGIAPQSKDRPKRGVTFIWDHEKVPY